MSKKIVKKSMNKKSYAQLVYTNEFGTAGGDDAIYYFAVDSIENFAEEFGNTPEDTKYDLMEWFEHIVDEAVSEYKNGM